jgi:hypothetical protein
LSAVVLASIFVAAGRSSGESPRTFLADIYVQYTDDEAPVLIWNGEDAQRLFEPALSAAIVGDARAADGRLDGKPLLDYDPFVQGDDYEINGLSIRILEATASTAMGVVAFRNYGRPAELRFVLVRNRGSWRIRDMRWGNTSIRAVYGLK